MLDNNQKAAYGILAAVAAVMAVTKYKNKISMMPGSTRNPNEEDLRFTGLEENIRFGSFAKHHQGYAARQDESLGMRTGAESHFMQSMKDRRNESYGKFGHRPNQHINR